MKISRIYTRVAIAAKAMRLSTGKMNGIMPLWTVEVEC